MRRTCAQADEAYCVGACARSRELSAAGAHPRDRARLRRRGHPSRLRLPVRERRVRREPAKRPASPSSVPRRADARLRPQAHGARAGAGQWTAAAAGQRPAAGSVDAALAEAAAHRLSGDAQEHGRRRRHRHAAVSLRAGAAATRLQPCGAWQPTTSAMPACSSRSSWPRPAHRSADLRRWPRHGHRAGRTRLLHAAPQPESHRRNTGTRASTDATRDALHDAAARLGSAVDYRSAGTVEFVFDADSGAVLFSRGEHAPAGGTRRHRGSRRHRPGANG